jgi:hypothetical protein
VLVFSADTIDLEPADHVVFLSKPASFSSVVAIATGLVQSASQDDNASSL